MTDDEYRELQTVLLEDPEAGAVIKGGGGIRKIRFGMGGRGKSGGVRTIYFWKKAADQIFMLVIYPKSTKDNLTAAETEVLRSYVKEL
ncbi:MAG: type II toxin-antitoxin system RelE/ParE family toxin [Burkholderiales bacterium]